MKKIIRLLVLLVVFCGVFGQYEITAEAASFSVSSSSSTVSAGGTMKVTIKASDCGGQFSISASNGAKVSSSSLWVENGSSSVTVTAPSSGSFTVTVTASDVANSAGTGVVTGSKSVSVSVSSKSNSSTTTTTDTRSSNTNLSTLTVDKGILSPIFASGTTSYTLDLVDESEITIAAKASDSKASVSGIGKKTISPGENKYSVVVTAENGTKKTYTITINLEVSPSVYTEFNGDSYGVVVDTSSVKVPSGFEISTVSINEEEISSWYNANCDLELVYLVDEEGTKGLYVIEEGEIISTFRTVALLGINLYALDIAEEDQVKDGMSFGEVIIDGTTLYGWSFDDEELEGYSIVQLMNKAGDIKDYLYCESTTSMIEYPMDKFTNQAAFDEVTAEVVSLTSSNESLSDKLNNSKTAAVAAGAVAIITTISTGIGFTMSRGYKKDYLRVKDLYSQNNTSDTPDLDLNGSELTEYLSDDTAI